MFGSEPLQVAVISLILTDPVVREPYGKPCPDSSSWS
ncbi:hypothetical protein PHET_00734 [Paragonimus heterotremus]|uniref:Uncharacterized protein n=1 Tax=Paragonimus heterotremus TaxID=100268 RepID=A0A8J4X3G8_9TREM|nr:hypothetical protein PHET_00734 [Paragonimus heterotremus]